MSDDQTALETTDEESVTQIQSDNGPADETTYRKAVNQIRNNIQIQEWGTLVQMLLWFLIYACTQCGTQSGTYLLFQHPGGYIEESLWLTGQRTGTAIDEVCWNHS